MPPRTLDEISNVSDWNGRQAATARTASGEPKGPGAIVVDEKVVKIATFPLALGRTDAGGPARVTGSPGVSQLRPVHQGGEVCAPSRL